MLVADYAACLIRKWIKVVCFAPFIALTGAPAHADGAGFQVCNRTSTYLGFAYIYRSGLGVLSDGWAWNGYYDLNAGECGFLFPTHDAVNAYMAVFASAPGEDQISPRILSLNDFRSSNRGASVSQDSLCLSDPGAASTGSRFALATHRSCTDQKKVPYSIYWTGIGQTHAEVNNAPHTLTITGIGSSASGGASGANLEAQAQAGFNLLSRYAASSYTLTRGGPCAVHILHDETTVTLDLEHLEPDSTTFFLGLNMTMQQPGASSVFGVFNFGKTKRPGTYTLPLNIVLFANASASEVAEVNTALVGSLRSMVAYCAAQD